MNDVDVFGAVQAVRGDPPRIGREGGCAVELRFERAGETVQGRVVGSGPPFRRHQSAAQLADDLLEQLLVVGHVPDVDLVEHEVAGLQLFVVTGHAVLFENRA